MWGNKGLSIVKVILKNKVHGLVKTLNSRAVEDFCGGLLVKTQCFHFRGCRFNPWSELEILNADPCCMAWPKNNDDKKTRAVEIMIFLGTDRPRK